STPGLQLARGSPARLCALYAVIATAAAQQPTTPDGLRGKRPRFSFAGHSGEAVAVSVTVAFAVARTSRPATERGNAIMLPTLKCPVIALEEHYWDKELAGLFVRAAGGRGPGELDRPHRL